MFAGNGNVIRRPAALVTVIVACAVAACGGDGDATADPSADAQMAVALCGALREQTNVLARVANSAVAGIEGKTPEARAAAIRAGFDAAEDAAVAFQRSFDAMALPDVPERDSLHDQVLAGAATAVDEVAEERALFVDGSPTVGDEDVQGRVGEFFNSIEKVMSVVEPAIAGYERRELKAAFLDEPTCRHVIQQFRLDE